MKVKKQGSGSKLEPAVWAQCFYDAFNRRDWEWLAAMMTPEVQWTHAGRDEAVEGVAAVISLLSSTLEGYPDASVALLGVHVAGDHVICECSITHRSAGSPPRQASFCEVIQIVDGRCARGSTYADSVRMVMELSTPACVAA